MDLTVRSSAFISRRGRNVRIRIATQRCVRVCMSHRMSFIFRPSSNQALFFDLGLGCILRQQMMYRVIKIQCPSPNRILTVSYVYSHNFLHTFSQCCRERTRTVSRECVYDGVNMFLMPHPHVMSFTEAAGTSAS